MKREWNQDISQFCIWLVDCVVSVAWWNKTIKCNPGLFFTLSCFNKLVAIIPFLWLKTQSDFFWRCLKFSSFWYSSVLCNLWLFLSLMNLLVNPLAELILTHNVIKNTFFFSSGKGPTPGCVWSINIWSDLRSFSVTVLYTLSNFERPQWHCSAVF